MKKILFDMTVYQTGTAFHGGGEYSYTVLWCLMERKPADVKVDIFIGERGRKDDAVLARCQNAGMNILCCRNAHELSEAIVSGGYDTLYSALPEPLYFKGLKLPPSVLMIITLHGLRKLELREGGMYKYFSNKARIKSDIKELVRKIIFPGKYLEQLKEEYLYLLGITENYIAVTDSYHSLYNTLRYFPQIGKDRIRMYYAPGKIAHIINDEETENSVLNDFGVKSKNFGLFLSADRMEKNPYRVMQAWDMVYTDCNELIPDDFKTVILGCKTPEKLLRKIKNKSRFIFKGYVEDEELETLYKHTHLLVFASLNEGFGYPPMEAMKYGTLVASSVNTSIPESCGDATLSFNPLIPSEIANRIMQSFDPDVRKRKLEQIPSQYEKIIKWQDADLINIADLIIKE